MSNLDIQNLTDEQLTAITAEARRRKMEKVRGEKYAKYEPHYTNYRKASAEVLTLIKEKKKHFALMKSLGWGVKEPKTTTTPSTTYPKTKGKGKSAKV